MAQYGDQPGPDHALEWDASAAPFSKDDAADDIGVRDESIIAGCVIALQAEGLPSPGNNPVYGDKPRTGMNEGHDVADSRCFAVHRGDGENVTPLHKRGHAAAVGPESARDTFGQHGFKDCGQVGS